MERVGWIGNFDRAAAGAIGGGHAGIEFVDSEVYKLLEAMAWELGREPNAALEAPLPGARAAGRRRPGARRLPAHQLRAARAAAPLLRPGDRARAVLLRSPFPGGGRPAAHRPRRPAYRRSRAAWRTTSTTEFGPDGRVGVCGHPEIEMALVELARATGEDRYLKLARSSSSAVALARSARTRSGRSTSRTTSRCARRRRCAGTRCARSTSPRARSTWRRRPATTSWPPRSARSGRTRWPAAPTSPAASGRITWTRRSATTSSCRPTARTPRPARASRRSC